MVAGADAVLGVPACRWVASVRQHAVPGRARHLAGRGDRALAVPAGLPAGRVRGERGQPGLALGRGRRRARRVRRHRRADGGVLRGLGAAAGALLLLVRGGVRLRARSGDRPAAAVAGLGAVQPAGQWRCRDRLRCARRRPGDRRAAWDGAGGDAADPRGVHARRGGRRRGRPLGARATASGAAGEPRGRVPARRTRRRPATQLRRGAGALPGGAQCRRRACRAGARDRTAAPAGDHGAGGASAGGVAWRLHCRCHRGGCGDACAGVLALAGAGPLARCRSAAVAGGRRGAARRTGATLVPARAGPWRATGR